MKVWTGHRHEPKDRQGLRNGLQRVASPLPDGQPIWIRLPIAEAERLSPNLEMPRYCETLRRGRKQRTATTFHGVISVPVQPDYVWVACADCSLMIEDYATQLSPVSQGRDAKPVVLSMEQERASISTHAIMDKVREMGLYPVVAAEGRFTSSKRLAHAMEIAYKALSAPDVRIAGPVRPGQGITAVTISSTAPTAS